jgi:hypothetical protein
VGSHRVAVRVWAGLWASGNPDGPLGGPLSRWLPLMVLVVGRGLSPTPCVSPSLWSASSFSWCDDWLLRVTIGRGRGKATASFMTFPWKSCYSAISCSFPRPALFLTQGKYAGHDNQEELGATLQGLGWMCFLLSWCLWSREGGRWMKPKHKVRQVVIRKPRWAPKP